MAFDLVSKKRTGRDWSIGSTSIIVINPPRPFWKPALGVGLMAGGAWNVISDFRKKKEMPGIGGLISLGVGAFLFSRR